MKLLFPDDTTSTLALEEHILLQDLQVALCALRTRISSVSSLSSFLSFFLSVSHFYVFV